MKISCLCHFFKHLKLPTRLTLGFRNDEKSGFSRLSFPTKWPGPYVECVIARISETCKFVAATHLIHLATDTTGGGDSLQKKKNQIIMFKFLSMLLMRHNLTGCYTYVFNLDSLFKKNMLHLIKSTLYHRLGFANILNCHIIYFQISFSMHS